MNRHGGYYGENKDKIIDFSININPLGISKSVINRIRENLDSLVRYPEIDGMTARGTIADEMDTGIEQIIVGNGATELIYLYARAIKADIVLIIQPAFNEYERAFRITGSRIHSFVLAAENGFTLNESKLLAKIKEIKPDVLILCNPNNPTGMFIEYQKLESVFNYMKEIASNILVDESFIYFTEEVNCSFMIDKYPIFILRSMTKFYAVPGIRLGYGIANEEIIKRLYLYKEPWTANSIALDITGVIFKDREYAIKTKEWLSREKKFIKEEMDKIKDLTVFSSHTNFYLCKLRKQKSKKLKEELLEKGIYIRTCEDFKGLNENYFRIAVRTHSENCKLITALKELV